MNESAQTSARKPHRILKRAEPVDAYKKRKGDLVDFRYASQQ